MTNKRAEFLEKLRALQQEFVHSLIERLTQLKIYEQRLVENWNAEDLQQFYISIHTLSGSSATFSFNRLSQSAKRLEEKISPFLQSEIAPSFVQQQSIKTAFLYLEDLLNSVITHSEEPDLVANEDLSAIVDSIQQEEQTGDNKLILLIEDDNVLAESIFEQIQAFGYRVKVLHDSLAIQQSLLQEMPCALIVDIILPEGNNAGIDAIKKIRSDYKSILPTNIPIIFISCRVDVEARLAAVKAGGSAYLTKPLDIGNLIEWLDKLVNRQAEEPYQILIVDDDKEVARHHALILENAGMLTTICHEPAQVLKQMENRNIDLVLMDLYMPDYQGNELASVIRQIDAYTAIPIIFLSTEHSSELQVQALLQGGDDFLIKPIRPETLVKMVTYRVMRFQKLRNLMSKDGLTGLYNHRHIKEQVRNEVFRAGRESVVLSVAMFDVDYFKKVNDTYGHGIGDRVLKNLSRFLIDRVRKTDLVGRYGGEEFVVIFPHTSIENAAKVCEKLRSDFEKVQHFYHDGSFSVTFSCGIASYPVFDEPQLLLDAADKALYASKNNGRNQVTVAGF
jgi:diguanylate cyclase (GGDEF)-like protein